MKLFAPVLAVALIMCALAPAGAVVVFGPATDTLISAPGDIGSYTPLLDEATMTATWRAASTGAAYSGVSKAASARPYTATAYYIQPSAGQLFPAGDSGLLFTAREDFTEPMNKGLVGTNVFAGVKVNELTKLSYWTSYPRAAFDYPNEIPASLQLWLTNGTDTRFVEWQPSHALVKLGQVMVDGVLRWQWNEWNALDDTNGTFRVFQDPVIARPWSQFSAEFGDWYFMDSVPFGDDLLAETNLIGCSFAFQMGVPKPSEAGMGNVGDSLWYQNQKSTSIVDKLEISYGGTDYLFDFEIVPEPGSLFALGAGLLGMAGLLRRKTG